VQKLLGCSSSSRSRHARFIAAHCRQWLTVDYGRLYGETSYSSVRRRCVFEASLLDERGNAPRDLKIFVMHGEPCLAETRPNPSAPPSASLPPARHGGWLPGCLPRHCFGSPP